jgi:hypothetical protein
MNAPPVVPPVFRVETSQRPTRKHTWLKAFIVAEFLLSSAAFFAVPYWARVMLDLGLKSDDLPAPSMFLIAVNNTFHNLIFGPSEIVYNLIGLVVTIGLSVTLWALLVKTKPSKGALIAGFCLMLGLLFAISITMAMPFVKVESNLSSDQEK